MKARHLWIGLFCLLICTALVLADTLKLKDGTILEGKVIPQGDNYWIKLTDGQSRIIPKNAVASFTPGDATKKPDAALPGKPAAAGAKPTAGITSTSSSFASVKAKADRVDAPMLALQLWDAYIATKPQTGDLEAAKAERAKWEALQKDNAERIKGVWVGGAERKKLVKQARNMVKEGVKQLEEGQSAAGFKKFEDAVNLYPQSFEANFYLGLYYLQRGVVGSDGRGNVEYQDKAVAALERAAKIAPKSSSVWSNLAVGYHFKKRPQDSVKMAFKAASMHESKDTVQNLVTAISYAPRGMREQSWCKPIMETTISMASRHGIQLGGDKNGWVYLPPLEGDEIPGGSGPAGEVWSGSGFFVTADGYFITNHHVACGDAKAAIRPDITFRIRMDDGTEKPATLIAVDDAADIALMKIEPEKPVVPIKLSADLPEQGSDALVLGYPATGEEEMTMQISPGTVKSTHPGEEYEVWFDLNTTHGNSGGPIVNSSNHVIAILTAGWESYNMTIVGGVGVNQIKTFLEKIADKAPKIEYIKGDGDGPEFNAKDLTKAARVSTVLVFAIKTSD